MRDEERRLAAARHVVEAQKCFPEFYDDNDRCWVHPATLQAMREAEQAFFDDDYGRAEHLAVVVIVMIRRDTAKFRANRAAWIAARTAEAAA
jgi:hypothetical protein